MRVAGALLLGCVLLAGGLRAQPAPPAATRVYGVEVEASETRDRVLVFADGPVRPQLKEVDRGTVMLSFPGARLDPSAPKAVAVEPGGAVQNVTVFETAGDPAEVRVTILRSAGISPKLSIRGQQVALDFDRPGLPGRRDAQGETEPTLPARWLNMQLRIAIERLARFVDMRLIFDDTLRGVVSIEAIEPLTKSEASAMIDSLLLLKGFAAVRGPAGVRKIVQLSTAPGPWVEALEANPDESPRVTLVRLRDIDASLVLQAIEPMIGKNGFAQLHQRTNGILLAGPGNRLRRVADVMRSLDEAGLRRLVLIPLRHTEAAAMADALLVGVKDVGGAQLEVWPDARTNRLVVRGRPDAVRRARAFIDRIDRPAEGTGQIQVIPVRYADADRLAEAIRGLASQELTSGVRGAASLAGRVIAVSVHPPTHSLVVQSDPATISLVRELIAELDQPPAMVDVEVMVAEVVYSDTLTLALDAIIPIVEPRSLGDLLIAVVASPSGSVLSTTSDSSLFARVGQSSRLSVPFVDPLGEIQMIPIPRLSSGAEADADETTSTVLLYPRLSMISGEEHEIFSGQNVPVPSAQTGATNPLQTSQTIERRDTGVRLRILPTVPKEGPIVLELDIEVSSLVDSIATGGPTFTERTLDATARLEPGRTALIGWARLPTTRRAEVGTPFLRRIPILGALFRRTEQTTMSRLLLITARAELQRPEAEVLSRWMQRALAAGAVAAPP